MLLGRPIFPVIFLDPDASGYPATFRGDRAQRQREFPGSRWLFSRGSRSGWVPPRCFPRPAGAALPCCGGAGGDRADRAGFGAASEAEGSAGHGAGCRAHTATLPSSLPPGDVQLPARSPASRARRPVPGCITPSPAGVSALSPSSQPQSHQLLPPSSGVHPCCWHRATRRGRLSPSLSLQADGRHQLPAASFPDNLSRPLPSRDTSSHSQ